MDNPRDGTRVKPDGHPEEMQELCNIAQVSDVHKDVQELCKIAQVSGGSINLSSTLMPLDLSVQGTSGLCS